MKNCNISKINQGGCNNLLPFYIFFTIISSIVLLVVILIALLVAKGTINFF